MAARPQIPDGVSEEERKALLHKGGHGEGHEGVRGQRADGGRRSDYDLPKHKPFNPDKGYTGHRK